METRPVTSVSHVGPISYLFPNNQSVLHCLSAQGSHGTSPAECSAVWVHQSFHTPSAPECNCSLLVPGPGLSAHPAPFFAIISNAGIPDHVVFLNSTLQLHLPVPFTAPVSLNATYFIRGQLLFIRWLYVRPLKAETAPASNFIKACTNIFHEPLLNK